MSDTTVTVVHDTETNAIRMYWKHTVDIGDVQVAFRLVQDILDRVDNPASVVIDLLSDPNFPLLTTLNCLVSGPLQHPQAREWLVVGSNSQVRIFAKTLADMDRTARTVRWFATDAQLQAHLGHLADSRAFLRRSRVANAPGTGTLHAPSGM